MKKPSHIKSKHIFSILAVFILMILTSGSIFAQVEVEKSSNTEIINGKEYYIHQVEAGQTLYSISKAYGISVEDILFENPEAKEGLQIDQQLKIPLVSRGQKINEDLKEGRINYIFHVVKAGQTLTSIASIYSVSVEDLNKLNPEVKGSLKVGQYLKIPLQESKEVKEKDKEKEETKTVMIRHKVKPMETWYSLSKEYNVTVAELRKANPGLAYPKVGELVNVPSEINQTEGQKPLRPDTLIHFVKPGETIYTIARNNGVSLDSIFKLNPGLRTVIHPGDEIKLPPVSPETSFIRHRVTERRSNLKKVAELYKVPLKKVEDMNPQISRRVVENQIVKIPVDEKILPEQDQIVLMPELEKEKLAKEGQELAESTFENIHQTYNVALMLPLSLEDVPAIDTLSDATPSQLLQSTPFRFIQFYQGFLMAADSLKKLGLSLDLHVYDIDQDISKTIKTLKLDEMNRMDLIIGPIYRNSFAYVANYARILGIPIVNPLSQKIETLIQNPFIFKVMPSRAAQADELAALVNRDFRYDNIILVYPNRYQDQNALNNIRAKLMDTLGSRHEIYNVAYDSDSLAGILRHTSVLKNNLIIVYSETEALSVDLMARLNDLRDSLKMTLIGIPEWEKFEHLENDYLMNLHTILFSSSFINYNDTIVKRFILDFREKYLAEPLEYAYSGYDMGTYFLTALMRYGRDFEHFTDQMNKPLLNTRFIFRKLPGGGYENTYWNIYRIDNYQLIPIIVE